MVPAKGKNDMTLSHAVKGSSRYYFYDVTMRGGLVVTIKTNLSEEDLQKYFPRQIEREAWMRTAALQSTISKPVR